MLTGRRWSTSIDCHNVGWTYHAEGNFEEALRRFEQALEVRLQFSAVEPIRIARWCIARCRRSLGQVAEALAGQVQLLAEFEASGQTSGYVWEELGECHLALGDAATARPYFALAHAELSQGAWLVAHEPQRLLRLRELGEGGA